MPNIELTLLIGQYAQGYYLEGRKKTLTETVRSFEDYLPNYFPLVHPSLEMEFGCVKILGLQMRLYLNYSR